jgi:hypothetical protein
MASDSGPIRLYFFVIFKKKVSKVKIFLMKMFDN